MKGIANEIKKIIYLISNDKLEMEILKKIKIIIYLIPILKQKLEIELDNIKNN